MTAGSSGRPISLVTGASAGLGREFCEQLAAEGHDLIVVGRDGARLHATRAELEPRYGIGVEPLAADLSRDAGVDRVVSRIAEVSPLAFLVNNAGFGVLGTIAEADPGPQADMLRLHALAPMRLAQAALPAMLAVRRGAIVNVSSVASFLYSAGNVNYCASKAYLRVFSEGLAAETRGSGVEVQALCPGFTRTEFHRRARIAPRVPDALWLDAKTVVRESLAALRRGGPAVVVPGFRYRAIVAALQVVPRSWVGRLADRRRG